MEFIGGPGFWVQEGVSGTQMDLFLFLVLGLLIF